MSDHVEWKDTLKYHEGEKFWVCYSDEFNFELSIQGGKGEISQPHLALAEKILINFEQTNQLALERLYHTIPSLKDEKINVSSIHVFYDEYSVTAHPVNFMFTYEYENQYDSKGRYVAVDRYTVKFMEKFKPIAIEEWFA